MGPYGRRPSNRRTLRCCDVHSAPSRRFRPVLTSCRYPLQLQVDTAYVFDRCIHLEVSPTLYNYNEPTQPCYQLLSFRNPLCSLANDLDETSCIASPLSQRARVPPPVARGVCSESQPHPAPSHTAPGVSVTDQNFSLALGEN